MKKNKKKMKVDQVEEKVQEEQKEDPTQEITEEEQKAVEEANYQIASLRETGTFRYYLLNNLANISETLKGIGQSLNNIGELMEEEESEEEEDEPKK